MLENKKVRSSLSGENIMTSLTNEQQDILLELARSTISNNVIDGYWEETDSEKPAFLQMAGAFVTIWVNDALRGCTGYMREDKSIYKVIQEMAISASTSDPRFSPLGREELDNISVGISVLSPLSKVEDIEDIHVGINGLLIVHQGKRGVLLPQVPTDRGWDRDTYLTNLCYKAGLPGDSWQQGAMLYSFTAEIFGEH
jgi:AmmeMemoRadiSam system protein A